MAALALKIFFLIVAFVFCFSHASRSNYEYTYIDTTRSSYKYHIEGADWAGARDICRSEGSLLFHPENEQELELVVSVLSVDPHAWIHTGLSNLENLTEYKTVDGRNVSQVFSNWRSGQPDSGADDENRCGRLVVAYREIFMGPCNITRKFICKDLKTIVATSNDKQSAILERIAQALEKVVSLLE